MCLFISGHSLKKSVRAKSSHLLLSMIMEQVPCTLCALMNQPVSNVTYNAIVQAFIQLTSYLQLKALTG